MSIEIVSDVRLTYKGYAAATADVVAAGNVEAVTMWDVDVGGKATLAKYIARNSIVTHASKSASIIYPRSMFDRCSMTLSAGANNLSWSPSLPLISVNVFKSDGTLLTDIPGVFYISFTVRGYDRVEGVKPTLTFLNMLCSIPEETGDEQAKTK
jgi:hypothetical protein